MHYKELGILAYRLAANLIPNEAMLCPRNIADDGSLLVEKIKGTEFVPTILSLLEEDAPIARESMSIADVQAYRAWLEAKDARHEAVTYSLATIAMVDCFSRLCSDSDRAFRSKTVEVMLSTHVSRGSCELFARCLEAFQPSLVAA